MFYKHYALKQFLLYLNYIHNLKATFQYKLLHIVLKLISFDSKVSDDDYVFILGFNYGSIPVIYKDEDFFNDEEKKLLGLIL